MKIKQVYQLFLISCLITILTVACHSSNPSNSISENCRMIQHKAGETCVPNHPERVVVLGVPTLADALALGVKPIGTILYFNASNAPSYLEDKLQGIKVVGRGNEPNLETIFSLNPDLIIMMYPNQGSYDKLSQIAPTIADDWFGFDHWKEHFNFVAKALGKTKEAQKVWQHYEQRIQELREALGDNYQDIEISVVRVCCNNLASDVKNSFSGIILNDVGLNRPPSQNSVPGGLAIFSEELITEKLDGDIIFAIVDDDQDSEKAFEQLKNNQLWSKLKAVQQGKVYPVNLSTWRGGNPLAADAVIDDLFRYLVTVV
ncbi:ABC transporter substrate-binding protein [Cyanobacterium aponinum]|uniref:ABC transporter substrate-binding protein n=1 Tax=Cyanobacterium aponinum 0216 TaxID=2676140 RepID=A0A844GV04_9CHRO|nr:iron-siderophore ABC transporter substrate-binding protein [Cyanobacterium aponinum]MTF38699.1 ABC transporter substrate-binding protein [Cyanobacterium aponinum 0216]